MGEGEGDGVGEEVSSKVGWYDGCAVGAGETNGTYPPANSDGAGVGRCVGPSVVGTANGERVGGTAGSVVGKRVVGSVVG